MKNVLLILIRIYQKYISSLLGKNCRFFPTCSCYAISALNKHNTLKGLWLIIKRIFKCGPWHPGGVDLVPNSSLQEFLDKHQDEQ